MGRYISGLFLLSVLWWPIAFAGHSLTSSHVSEAAVPAPTGTSFRPVFTVPSDADTGARVIANIHDPDAVSAQDVCPGYQATNLRNTSNGFIADLNLAGTPCHLYGNDIENLTLVVSHSARDRLSVQIQPRYIGRENETWFILPDVLVPRPLAEPNGSAAADNALDFSWSHDPTFAFTITRRETEDVLFTTQGSVLVYEDQFIEFVSPLPEEYNLYGLGETIHEFRLGNNLTRTLFNADVGDSVDANLYGSHPIYLDTRFFVADESGALTYHHHSDKTDPSASYVSFTHGVFLRNAHAQEVLLRDSPPRITWRALGGSIDLNFYAGPNATDVMASYQLTTSGLPAMQQYWTFGYHQCRWGYENWTVLQDVVDNFAKFEIPLETIWTDIDYMNQYRDFDNDAVRFGYAEGEQFLARLHANNQHYVPIVDSAIYAPNYENSSDEYAPFERGIDADAFMLNPDGSIYYGAVWPGYTAFPDWVGAVLNGTGTIDWWINEIVLWREQVAFDGIWIDMSEVSSFCVGSCGSDNLTLNPVHPPFSLPGEPGNLVLSYPEGFGLTNSTEASSASSASYAQAHPPSATSSVSSSAASAPYLRTIPTPGVRNINWPPYTINHVNGDLAVHAVSPNATHHGLTKEWDFHNLFGNQILNATYQALLEALPGKRPFIIGRSTFSGAGKWAGSWGGDNTALWAYMYFSIPQALSFSIFGIPMFGADTCGFNGNTDYELCSRWMQLSAFFPFYRNHNVLAAISQEPYVWSSVMDASKKAMRIRYALLPYLYTLFALANQSGSTVMRALAWEFPNEPWLAAADRQFMLGNAILVTPCLAQGATTVDGVFPGVGDGITVWYDWYDFSAVAGVQPGQNVTVVAPLGHIPVFLRGGTVVPLQQPGMTTAASRNGTWSLLVALSRRGTAAGTLYLDDGESLEPEEVTWIQFRATRTSVAAEPRGNYDDINRLANVTVLGLVKPPTSVSLNGRVLNSAYWVYNASHHYLSLNNLDSLFSGGAWSSSWIFTWA